MSNYMLTITMNDGTANELQMRGMRLIAFKAVMGSRGQPLVWFVSYRYGLSTSIGWETRYEAYTSNDEIVAHGQIHAGYSDSVDLGNTFVVTGDDGTGEVRQEGQAGAITIRSQARRRFTCGILQKNEDGFMPVCAFASNPGLMDLITPVEKVLVMFASDDAEPGTVIIRSAGPGVLVDLTGAEDHTRVVKYDAGTGWDCNGAPWCQQVAMGTELASLLIESQAGLEVERIAPR